MLRAGLTYTFLILLLFTACRDTNSLGAINDIEEAKKQWETNNFTSYHAEVERICFCPPPPTYQLVVQKGEVIEVRDLESGEPVSSPEAYQTVEDIFSWLQRVAAENPKKLELEFHPQYGYPTLIDYNQSDQIIDEELFMRINNLKAD